MAMKPGSPKGAAGKPAPKKATDKKVFSGTGKVTKPMPELRKTGGVGGPAVKPKAGTKAGPSVASTVAKRVVGAAKTVSGYQKNVATQVGQAAKATAKSAVSAYSPKTLGALKGSKAEAANKSASAKARKQVGQALGAVTQNRKYKD